MSQVPRKITDPKQKKNIRQTLSTYIKQNSNQIIVKNEANKEIINVKQINDIVFNEKVHLVAQFKDFLILDDSTEFLKRFYNKIESKERLNKIFDFYEENSKIFPNYIILSESRYIYKNIQKKQKLIDQLQEMEMVEKEKQNSLFYKEYKNKVINTEDCNSIMNQTQSIFSQTKNNSFNSVEQLIDHIEKVDFYKDNNYQNVSKKVDIIVMNKESDKSKGKIEQNTSKNNNKTYQMMNSILEKKLIQQDSKVKDKFFMKKLILNPNKVSTTFKQTKINSKKDSAVLKLDSLKTIDLDVKINSHRDRNKNNITQSNNADKYCKVNNTNILYTDSKMNISKNGGIDRPSSNHKTIEGKFSKENTSKKLVYHQATMSMPKLNSTNLNNIMNNKNQNKNELQASNLKVEAEKQGIKIIDTSKNSTRNFKQRLASELIHKSSGVDKNIIYSTASGINNFQTTFNLNSTHNIFGSRNNNKNQLNTISPDLITRQTLDNCSMSKLFYKEKAGLAEKKSDFKVVKNNYYNNSKNNSQKFLTFLNNNKINENSNKTNSNAGDKKKAELKQKNQIELKQKFKILYNSKSPLNSDKFVFHSKKQSEAFEQEKNNMQKNKNHPILMESSSVLVNPHSARLNYK